MPNKLIRTETRNLSTKLNDTELAQRSQSLAQTIHERGAEEERQKNIKDQMKAKLSELDSRKTQLALVVSSREEYRDVPVRVVLEEDDKVHEYRLDTGAEVGQRDATAADRAQPFPGMEQPEPEETTARSEPSGAASTFNGEEVSNGKPKRKPSTRTKGAGKPAAQGKRGGRAKRNA